MYFILVLVLPTEAMSALIPMWEFRNELALLIMCLSFARIAIEVLSTIGIAVGFIGRQLYINLMFLFITFICGLVIPFIGLEYYLMVLTVSAFLISMFIYVTTFNRLDRGKNGTVSSL